MATIRKLRGRWQAAVRRKGMQPRSKSFDSKSDAERWARSLEAELDRNGALPDTRPAESTTLAQILIRYRDEVSPTKRSAVTEVARINGILRRPLCHRTMTLLSTADLAAYRDERLKTVAPATAIRELNTISHAIDTARREWGIHIAQNPYKLVRRPSPPKGRTRRLEGNEEQLLLAAADQGRVPYLRPLIELAVETGMRRGELLSLRWEHVDLDRRVAHLPLTKNGSSRDVPLSTRAVDTLRRLRTGESATVCSQLPRTPSGLPGSVSGAGWGSTTCTCTTCVTRRCPGCSRRASTSSRSPRSRGTGSCACSSATRTCAPSTSPRGWSRRRGHDAGTRGSASPGPGPHTPERGWCPGESFLFSDAAPFVSRDLSTRVILARTQAASRFPSLLLTTTSSKCILFMDSVTRGKRDAPEEQAPVHHAVPLS